MSNNRSKRQMLIRQEKFLEKMDGIMLWRELESLIALCYSKGLRKAPHRFHLGRTVSLHVRKV